MSYYEKAKTIEEHDVGNETCRKGACLWLKGRISRRKCFKCDSGIYHAMDSNWDDYSFGHSGGPVYFTMKCDVCSHTYETMG